MTREQLATFLAASQALPESLSALFLTLARTGMQWNDITFASREIRVSRGFSRGRLETPKSGIARTVDMSQQLSKALMRPRSALERKRLGDRHLELRGLDGAIELRELAHARDAVIGSESNTAALPRLRFDAVRVGETAATPERIKRGLEAVSPGLSLIHI